MATTHVTFIHDRVNTDQLTRNWLLQFAELQHSNQIFNPETTIVSISYF
jgi:hypothetical protein